VVRSPINRAGLPWRWQKLTLPLRVLYLARPGLITKVLAIVAFFSIGIV
jgi:hypothetical protein